MAASRKKAPEKQLESDEPERRRRFSRSGNKAAVALTPIKLQILRLLLDYRFLLVTQTAKLTGLSDQAARRHLRELFDAAFVERIAVPRSALADDGETNDANLTFGSAQAIHTLSKSGIQLLSEAGIAEQDALRRPAANYGPQNSLFLRHELFVRDIRIWLSTLGPNFPLISWTDTVDIGKETSSKPDGVFALEIGSKESNKVMAGFIEADRGTERGPGRWTEKLSAYAEVFSDPSRTAEACGYKHARVLIVTRQESRRDRLWEAIEEIGTSMELGAEMLERFWIADKTVLNEASLSPTRWRIPGVEGIWPLISE